MKLNCWLENFRKLETIKNQVQHLYVIQPLIYLLGIYLVMLNQSSKVKIIGFSDELMEHCNCGLLIMVLRREYDNVFHTPVFLYFKNYSKIKVLILHFQHFNLPSNGTSYPKNCLYRIFHYICILIKKQDPNPILVHCLLFFFQPSTDSTA